MRAIVLVGGFGTRLRPLTDAVPKSMLPVAHVPLIVRLIGQLERGGVDAVTLALGFLPEPFVEAFPDGRCGEVTLDYAIESEPLDTAGAIRFAADHAGIDETFVVANGDILTDLSIADLVAAHRAAGAEATIHLIPVEDPSAFGVVQLDDDGRILRFVEKPPPGSEPSNLINAGTYVLEPSVLARIPVGRKVSIERETFPLIAADGRFHSMATKDYWIDAGRPQLFLEANLDLINGRRDPGAWGETCEPVAPGAVIHAEATVVDSIIGARSTVARGAAVSGSVLLPDAVVGADAVVEGSVVAGRVGRGARLVRAVVGADAIIPDGEHHTDARIPEPAGEPVTDEAARAAVEGGVLVIGGAGFIGSHLVERLIAEGESVDVVDDLSTGSLGNLADARAEAGRLASSDLRIHTLDATGDDLAALIAMRRPREIYHLALLARSTASAVALGRSFTSMLGVLDAARRSGVTKVVVTLPATSMYGHPSGRELPVREGILQPRGVRGVVAKAVVDLLSAYREGWGIEFTALAPATVYGPRQRPDAAVLPAMIAAAAAGRSPRITGDGRQTRDFVYVDDVVDALVRSGRRGSGLVVNVGTGVQTSLRDLWALIAPEAGAPTFVAARPDELARFAVSPVRARIHLAWSPWTGLDEGLAALR